MPFKGSHRKTKHSKKYLCITYCFTGPSVSVADDGEPPVDRCGCSWSGLQKRKKTVSVIAPEEMVAACKELVEIEESLLEEKAQIVGNTPEQTKLWISKNFLAKFFKARTSRSRTKARQSHHQTKSNKPHVSTKYKELGQHRIFSEYNNTPPLPAPPSLTPDRVRPVTRTSSPNSPVIGPITVVGPNEPAAHPVPVGGLGRISRLLIPVLTLAVIVFFGRAAGITCLSSCFYFMPVIRPQLPTDDRRHVNEEEEEVDMNSPEYKKKVVLQGLLERHGRKPSFGLHQEK